MHMSYLLWKMITRMQREGRISVGDFNKASGRIRRIRRIEIALILITVGTFEWYALKTADARPAPLDITQTPETRGLTPR